MRITKMRVEIELLIIAIMVASCLGTTEVDNLNLLLPQLKDSSRALPLQLITAQGGCYTWASSAPSILSASPHETKGGTCSKQAVVQVVQPGAYSSSIYVTATDTATESVLNIPVRIRKLNKISIATKSRMMNLKEIQKIELFAHDSDENTFTSLEGLRFVWTLEQKLQILETVPLDHAQLYLPLRIRENLQKEGYQSDILVVRALAPGNLKIIARCIEPGYQHLTDVITISVHERFELKPGPTLRMAASSSYQLYLERPTKEVIILPQFYYDIKSCPGFQINSTLYLTVSNFSSNCEIRVEDTRTIPPYSSSINVIVENPTQIRIISQPIIIVGEDSPYEIQFFNSKQEILFGTPSNLKIQSDFSIDTGNKVIQASKKTEGFIRASLNQLKSQHQIIALLPIRALLPSNSLHLPVEETFKLRLVGGSGIYDYNVNNEVGIISSLGVLICKQVGQANITVFDRSHPANRAVIRLKVSNFASIKSLEQQKQVNRDEWGHFYIIGRNNYQQTFTQCLSSQFSLTIPSHKLEIDKKSNFSESIRFLTFHHSRLVQQSLEPTSLLKGKAEDIISSFNIYVQSNEIDRYDLRNYIYNLENYGICEVIRFRSLVSFEDRALIELLGIDSHVDVKVPLRVYEPITTFIEDDASTFLMTPLSSLTWNYAGGSYPWINSQTKIAINGLKQPNLKPIISCPNTETSITSYQLKLQNEQTKFLLFPTQQKNVINITCKFPKKLQLLLENGNVFDEIYINPNAQVSGSVQPLDENGNQFYNSSNVEYQYSAKTGQIEGKNTEFKYKALKQADRIKIYSDNLREGTNFKRVELQFSVSVVDPVKIGHLLLNDSNIVTQDDKKRHTQIITLFTPKKPYLLTLGNVSPLLQIKCNESVSCEKFQNRLNVNLLTIGRGFVTLKDKRVYGGIEWIFEFIIVEADQIVVTGERDYVPQGDNVNIFINNYYKGQLISPLLYQDNYLQLNIDRNLKILEQNGNRFLVNAGTVGRYEIHGEQGYPRTIKSAIPFVLNVYERVQPDIAKAVTTQHGKISIVQGETTVVIGCKRILRVTGGPKDMLITYQNDNSLSIASLSYNTFTIIGKKQGQFSLSLQVKNFEEIIALIKLKVIVSIVESVELSSIDEPVIGAQFRILPRFKVGESQVEGCICDFDYKWSTSKQLIALGSSTSFGFLASGGVNATAIREGNEIISLLIEDKATRKVIGQAQRYIKVLKEIQLSLPTLINKPTERTETLRISPLTTYFFDKSYQIESKDDLLKIGSESSIEASKKVGHSTIKLSRDGFRTEIVEVEVQYISGIFIENEDGFLGIQPNSVQNILLHLYDNHGRLFVTPMLNLPIHITSSNPDVLKASITTDQKQIILEGLKIGTSVLTIGLSDRNIYDCIAVSVGSQIIPSSDVRILRHGIVHFSLPTQTAGKWHSYDPTVAIVNEQTGETKALAAGRAKIGKGNAFGWIHVTTIEKIEQVSLEQTTQGFQIVYKAIWNGKNGEEQLPSFYSTTGAINNNFKPACFINTQKWFEVKSYIRQYQNHQRLVCNVKVLGSPDSTDFPHGYSIYIIDNQSIELAKFDYSSIISGFAIDRSKKNIVLTSREPASTISIRTLQQVSISTESGNSKYLSSTFNEKKSMQEVRIDMTSESADRSWGFDLISGNQVERIQVSFKYTGESPQDSFSLPSFDWSEYLIVIMAIVFGILCFIQYYNEQKIKNS